MVAYLCTFLVGAVFLFTAAAKTIDSSQFSRQIRDYRFLPMRWVREASVVFIGLEWALGVALVLSLFFAWLIPATIALLVGLSLLTIWGTSSGRVEDCGCYGGILLLTPRQSILLNLGYILLLGVGWFFGKDVIRSHELWRIVPVPLALIVGGVLAWKSQREPLIDLTRLKVGKRWGKRWLKANSPGDGANSADSQTLEDGTHFVVFMSQNCPYCKDWVPLLNVMAVQQDMPAVMGIMSLTEEKKEEFIAQHLVRFPINFMDKGLVRMMVQAFPTAALIENGVIANKWRGEIPQPYFDRIRQFYESVSPNRPPQKTAFAG